MEDAPGTERLASNQLISDLRDRFERDWLDGARPNLEEVVRSVPESIRPEVFRHLLSIECQYRARALHPILLAEALDRFGPLGPWTEPIVRELLGATVSWGNVRDPHPPTNSFTPPARASAPTHTSTSTPTEERQQPRLRLGQYELLAKLGSGASGAVFKARHTQLKRLVALKVLIPHRVLAPDGVERFRIEMEVLGRLNHPHIIRATDAGEAEGYLYLAMEYVAGVDLGYVLKKAFRLALPQACELARQAAEALAHIDRHGLVHRDVKPNNLLLGRDGVLRVLDLGLAQLRDAPPDERLTETGAVMGTPEYIAPEQTRESRTVDIRADVYGLGCTLFALLAGAPPFIRTGSIYEIFRAHNETPPPALSTARDGVPAELERLILRMLEKEPAQRPGPQEVVRALLPFCAGHDLGRVIAECGPAIETAVVLPPVGARLTFDAESTKNPPATDSTQVLGPKMARHPRGRTRRWALGAAVLAVALALGGVGWALWLSKGTSSEPSPEPAPAPGPPPEAPLPPRTFKSREWNPLLDRPPVVRQFPNPPNGSHWHLEEKTRELYINSTEWGVFELAQLKGAFDFEVTVSQNPWVGGVGAFFRGREEQLNPQTVCWGNFILLERFEGTPDKNQAALKIGDLRRFVASGRCYPNYTEGGSVPWPLPGTTHKLAFSLSATGLTNVTWDGVAVAGIPAGICGPLPDRVESVGVVIQNCAAWFHSVQIRPHEPPGERP
jgi:serine/threonine protein kinase